MKGIECEWASLTTLYQLGQTPSLVYSILILKLDEQIICNAIGYMVSRSQVLSWFFLWIPGRLVIFHSNPQPTNIDDYSVLIMSACTTRSSKSNLRLSWLQMQKQRKTDFFPCFKVHANMVDGKPIHLSAIIMCHAHKNDIYCSNGVKKNTGWRKSLRWYLSW